MFSAEIQHFLGFGNAADQRTSQHPPLAHQCTDLQRGVHGLQQPDHDLHAIDFQAVQVRIEVMLNRNRVQQVVEAIAGRLHLRAIGGDHHVVGTLALGLGHLAFRAGEDRHLGAHGLGELHAHVAQPAHTDDADLIPWLDAKVTQR